MSKKVIDLDKNERNIIEEQLESISTSLGMDSYESYGNESNSVLKDLIGMCYNCKNLYYCKTEFSNVYAYCSIFEFKLSGQNRITECNLHSPKNVLTLQEMYSMAYLIDPAEEKIEGFISNNPKLRNKK